MTPAPRAGPGELSTRLPAAERGAARGAEITPGEGASCIPVPEVVEGGGAAAPAGVRPADPKCPGQVAATDAGFLPPPTHYMGVRPECGENHQKKTDRGIQNALCDSQAFNNAIATFHVGGWMNPLRNGYIRSPQSLHCKCLPIKHPAL